LKKKVPGGVIRVARALLWHDKGTVLGRVQKRATPSWRGVQGAYPRDAFWYIFSDKKCFLGRHCTLELNKIWAKISSSVINYIIDVN